MITTRRKLLQLFGIGAALPTVSALPAAPATACPVASCVPSTAVTQQITIACGTVYDRKSLERWLRSGGGVEQIKRAIGRTHRPSY